MSICYGCRMAADEAKGLGRSADHSPMVCRDKDLDEDLPYGHGCTCQHNMGVDRPSAATR